jgi:hypothetical protein
MSNSVDELIYEMSKNDEVSKVPYVEKNIPYISDNSLGNYEVCQVEFSTSTSSNGGFINYKEGVFVFPITFGIASEDDTDFTNLTKELYTDLALGLKNSHTQLIHSIQLWYNNKIVLQNTPYLNQYISFIQNTEYNSLEEDLNGKFIGYFHDTPTSWGYNPGKAPRTDTGRVGDGNAGEALEGYGLYNNVVMETDRTSIYSGSHSLCNTGLKKRQQLFTNPKAYEMGKDLVYDVDRTNAKGYNFIERTTDGLFYHCYAVIRMRDLPFFKNLDAPIKGADMRILFTLNNNVEFTLKKDVEGNLKCSNFRNAMGFLTNPLMVSAGMTKTIISEPTDNKTIGLAVEYIGSGSACLLYGTAGDPKAYTVKMNIGGDLTIGIAKSSKHPLNRCRLYVPSYIMNPDFREIYEQNSQRVIAYKDILFNSFNVNVEPGSLSTTVNYKITAGIANASRLILMGFMNNDKNGNGGDNGQSALHSLSSPFTTEGATTSPFQIQNMQVQLGSTNLYKDTQIYSYETFLREFNHQQGINGNQICGLGAGFVDIEAFQNNYHYIVVNLSRRLPIDDTVSQSIEISFDLISKKSMTFNSFLEVNKELVIDVSTGNLVQTGSSV